MTPKKALQLLVGTAAIMVQAGALSAFELGLPAGCAPGQDCFFQQYPDMAPGPGAKDPFCGSATYDGHDGTDLRILSMADVARGVPVLAVAGGTVLRLRDGEPDRLMQGEVGRAAISGKECGNGVAIEHNDGFETQYCHLRQGSISVAPGATVRRGDKIGEIGASGMAQFPHVHLTVRRHGEAIDPATGRTLSEGCLADLKEGHPLFASGILAMMNEGRPELLAFGLAGNVIDHRALVVDGPPPTAHRDSPAAVVWSWFSNLRAGDRIRVRLEGPDGRTLADHTTDPLDRTKADYSAYAGMRGGPAPGRYIISVMLLRGGAVIGEKTRAETVE